MQLFGSSNKATAKTNGASAVIKDGTLETFAQDVVYASQEVPVLVDFWAPWCGPCKQLTPMLEKLVTQAKGKIKLVKINIDAEPEIAQQFRIQSVPTVYAFLQGQPVTGFAGAQPESQIKALIDKLIGGTPADGATADLDEAKRLADAGRLQDAASIYNELLHEDPENAEALGGLARCLLQTGQVAEAKQLLSGAPPKIENHTAITGAKAAIQLAEESGELGDVHELQARVERDPDDHEARYRLATSLFLGGQATPAMEHLCRIVKTDRGWQDDKARKQLVRFFDVLGPKDPETLKGRRMLSTVLFS